MSYIKSILLLIIVMFLVHTSAKGQSNYYTEFNEGMELYNKEKYYDAYLRFNGAKTFAEVQRNVRLVKKAQAWIDSVVISINTKLKQADIEKRKADSLFIKAEHEKKKAQSLTLVALAREQIYENPTYSLRLAEMAWLTSASKPPLLNTQKALTDAFYKPLLNGNLCYRQIEFEKPVQYAFFSPNGKLILAFADSEISIWDAKTLQLVSKLNGLYWSNNPPRFSPDGKKVLAITTDGFAIIADSRSGNLLLKLSVPDERWNDADFSPDGKMVATSSPKGIVRIWDAENGKLIKELARHDREVNKVHFSPDGKLVAGISDEYSFEIELYKALVWELNSGKLILKTSNKRKAIRNVSFSPDSKTLVAVGADLTLWNTKTGSEKSNLKGHEMLINMAAFSSDGQRIVSASNDNTAKLWDVDEEKIIAVLKGHSSWVHKAVFSPDGKKILTCSEFDNYAKIWNAKTGEHIGNLFGSSAGITDAHFSPDNNFIVTSSNDSTVKIWTINPLIEKYAAKAYFFNGVFSPDSKKVVLCTGYEIHVIDAETGELLFKIDWPKGEKVSKVLFSKDGKKLISSFNNKMVWDATTGDVLKNSNEDVVPFDLIEISEKTNKKISNSSGKVRLTEWTSGRPISDFNMEVNKVTFSPDGKRILATYLDEYVKILLAPEGIMEWLKTTPIKKLTQKDLDDLGIDFIDLNEFTEIKEDE